VRLAERLAVGRIDHHRLAEQLRVGVARPVLVRLAHDVGRGAGDAAGQEGGDVQLLPRLEVSAYGDGDLGIETHGTILPPAAAPVLNGGAAVLAERALVWKDAEDTTAARLGT